MTSAFRDNRLEILTTIEDELFKRSSNFRGDNAARLYELIRGLKSSIRQIDRARKSETYNETWRLLEDDLDDILRKISRIGTTPSTQPMFEAVVKDAEDFNVRVRDLAKDKGSDEYTQTINDLQDQLREYEKLVSGMKEKAVIVNTTADRLDSTAGKLATAVEYKATKEWTDEYLQYIAADDTFKRKYEEKLARLKGAKKATRREKTAAFLMMGVVLPIYRLFQVLFRERMFYSGKSYENITAKWRIWRSFWLFVLFSVAVIYLFSFWNADTTDMVRFFIEKTKYVPLLVVISIGFTFSARNFKINAHLLEQYKHRYIVAKTMHNLMTLEDLQGDGAIKTELLQQGSRILFEFKPSGYMNKGDQGEGMPIQEVIELAKSFNSK